VRNNLILSNPASELELPVDSAGRSSAAAETYEFNVGAGAGPAAWWKFDDAPGTTVAADASGHGRTATLATGANVSAYGRVGGGSLNLDGATGYAATTSPVVDTTQSFSVSTWVRLTDKTRDNTLLGQAGTDGTAFQLYFSTAYGWTFNQWASDTTAPAAARAQSSLTPKTYVRTHLVGVFDAASGKISLWVNGQHNPALDANVTTPWNATGPFTIGCYFGAGTCKQNATAHVDDVRVYNRVLELGEITDLANNIQDLTDLPKPALVDRWLLDETSGTTAADATTYDNRHR
jgi:Concanavalin A-like lectin/glucanases superfamily